MRVHPLKTPQELWLVWLQMSNTDPYTVISKFLTYGMEAGGRKGERGNAGMRGKDGKEVRERGRTKGGQEGRIRVERESERKGKKSFHLDDNVGMLEGLE